MESIPNKSRDILGVIVDIHLHTTAKGDYLEISVEDYPYPVNYKGQYHYRSGSTKQELKGSALDKFMLRKKGKRWDSVPVPNVSIEDLDTDTFDFFKKRAFKNKRIEEDALTDSNDHLIENLQLKENIFLKRACILLFHPKPQNFVTGAYVKIGFFESDTELMYQDEVQGNLFNQVEKTIDLLFTKYIKALISYEGIHRVETYEYPKDAIREALLNAVSHKDYSSGIPVQISVYKDKLMIWNDGILPENWTAKMLIQKHSSKPFNPDIANAFFRSGYIESWGRGTVKIIEKCVEAGLPSPTYHYEASDFWLTFYKDIYNEDHLNKLDLNDRQLKAVEFVKNKTKISNTDYQTLTNVSERTALRDLDSLVSKGVFQKRGLKKGTYYEISNGGYGG